MKLGGTFNSTLDAESWNYIHTFLHPRVSS
jgi:hypothetical protein